LQAIKEVAQARQFVRNGSLVARRPKVLGRTRSQLRLAVLLPLDRQTVGLKTSLLTDDQLPAFLRAALQLPVEKRNRLLQLIADRLQLPDGRYSQSDLDNAVRMAGQQLVREFSRPPGTILWLDREVCRVRNAYRLQLSRID
jgi:hypothetical protein